MTGELHGSDSADHAAPEVIWISPPVRARTSPLVAWLACGSLTIAGFANAILGWGNTVALFSLFYFGLAAVAFWRFRVGNAAHAAARQRLMSQLNDQENQILADAVRRLWRKDHHVPTRRQILDVVLSLPPPTPPRARVVVLGDFQIPAVGNYRFEPEVVSPTRRLGRQFLAIPIAMISFVLLWLIWRIGHLIAIPFMFAVLGVFLVTIVLTIRVVAIWCAQVLLRSAYLRIAPRMIQTLHYAIGRRKPQVRSFPVIPGTTVVLEGRILVERITLSRGRARASVWLGSAQDLENLTTRLWHALLSTAPTPPLSDEELVG